MPKRSESTIMSEIQDAYIGLSPENLSCDGELSSAQTRTKWRELQARLKSLFQELGREVSETEALGMN